MTLLVAIELWGSFSWSCHGGHADYVWHPRFRHQWWRLREGCPLSSCSLSKGTKSFVWLLVEVFLVWSFFQSFYLMDIVFFPRGCGIHKSMATHTEPNQLVQIWLVNEIPLACCRQVQTNGISVFLAKIAFICLCTRVTSIWVAPTYSNLLSPPKKSRFDLFRHHWPCLWVRSPQVEREMCD